MKHSIFILCVFLTGFSHAQNVDLITYLPVDPQPGDTLTIFCHVTYGTPGCVLMEKNIYLGGNAIFAEAFHCVDSFNHPSILCPTIDTFSFVTLPFYTGIYPFYYMPGYYDKAPCVAQYLLSGQPIPHPYVIGSIDIEVGTISSIDLNEKQNIRMGCIL